MSWELKNAQFLCIFSKNTVSFLITADLVTFTEEIFNGKLLSTVKCSLVIRVVVTTGVNVY